MLNASVKKASIDLIYTRIIIIMKKITASFIVLTLLVTSLFSCSKNENKNDNPANTFDKAAMLSSYADNLIIPAYATMQQKITALQTASDAFTANPNAGTQAALKNAYSETHLQYIRIASFNFGPAENVLLDNYLNFSGGLDYSFTTDGALTGFSVDTVAIANNISSGSYNLEMLSRNSFYSQGFPALNYLYFGHDAISKMDSKRAKYINDLLARMKTLVDKVNNDWSGYRAKFVSNTQTNSGSPIAFIVNQLSYQLDLLKGPRIGWPLGKQSNGKIFETKCEAYYAGISITLAVENLNSIKRLYTGNNVSGKGLSDYLVALKQSTLNSDVLAQFDIALAKLKSIPDPLSNSLLTQPTKVDEAYKEIQKLVTLMKTDVASATAVQISYTDNDGD
jgi:predicted lipoprotein